jgi:hypothetical protein
MPSPYRYLAAIVCAAALSLSLPGCLHLGLGGRTTVVHEKPETTGRISALETRVSALEQVIQGQPAEHLPTPAVP